jgi:hypothetical protein
MTRRIRMLFGAIGLVFALMQVIPMQVKNPPVTQNVPAPPQVEAILRRGCYDCHSNQTRWPWYAHVAPVSWLVARDVARGREQINFSTWDKYSDDPETVIRKLRNIDKEMQGATMPLWYYLLEHADARLSDADREAIDDWVMQSISAEDKREQAQP